MHDRHHDILLKAFQDAMKRVCEPPQQKRSPAWWDDPEAIARARKEGEWLKALVKEQRHGNKS